MLRNTQITGPRLTDCFGIHSCLSLTALLVVHGSSAVLSGICLAGIACPAGQQHLERANQIMAVIQSAWIIFAWVFVRARAASVNSSRPINVPNVNGTYGSARVRVGCFCIWSLDLPFSRTGMLDCPLRGLEGMGTCP